MLTNQVGAVLRAARRTLGWSQAVLAGRTGVSTRLVAELEQGRRANVSLETALRLLAEAGVSVRLTDPSGAARELSTPDSAAAARAARAAVRRTTWSGRQLRLAEEGLAPAGADARARRLAEVEFVSRQAFAVAGATPAKSAKRSRSNAPARPASHPQPARKHAGRGPSRSTASSGSR